jgi:hypothetical protein
MRHRARQAATRVASSGALALTVVVAVAAVAGCAAAAATAGAPASPRPAATAPATTGPATTGPASTAHASTGPAATGPAATGTAAPVYGPPAPDAACLAAEQAEQALQSSQTRDQDNESALDQDFTNFAAALTAAAQREKRPATARAMTALANDYTDLVQSQSGAAQLPDMSQVQSDGAAFDKACSA